MISYKNLQIKRNSRLYVFYYLIYIMMYQLQSMCNMQY